MAIKLADTTRPNNYVDEQHKGTFPVAWAEDIWFADGTRLSDVELGGESIQKEELPLASADELGNIYQYVGESGTYINGHFYKCILNSSVYSWSEIKMVENPVVYSDTVPDINAYETGSIVCYTGENSGDFAKGHLYQKNETSFTYYYWTFYRDLEKTQPYVFYTQETTLANGVNVYQADPITGEGDISLVGSISNYQEFSFFVVGSSTVQYFYPEADTSKNRIITEGNWIDIGGGNAVGGIIDVETLPTSNIKNTFYRVTDSLTSETQYYAGNETAQTTERIAIYDTFTGTQAEWDALSVSEKAQYTIVNITDDVNGTDSDYYSTTETKTNKVWIDGKPIYRKVVTGLSVSIPSDTWVSATSLSNFPNIETIISATGLANDNAMLLNFDEVQKNNNNLRVEISVGGTRTLHTIIVEYTKTTD